MPFDPSGRSVPRRALLLSAATLVAPAAASFLLPEDLRDYGALLWLIAVVPVFVMSYYRGWNGGLGALMVGLATLALAEASQLVAGHPLSLILPGVVGAFIVVSIGIGGLAEVLHRDRAAVEDMAFTDLLTHLPNRRHARLFLENEYAAAERGRPLALVLFDLDHFKGYNDEFGHPAGDAALSLFGGILAQTTRRMDLSGRFGGEEFVSVLASTETEGAVTFAERIRSALEGTRLEAGGHLTVSAGVATYYARMQSADELLAAADHALYRAKREGRNRVCLYRDSLMDVALPSEDAVGSLADRSQGPQDYPRPNGDIGRTKPPLTLLPHQITGFGEGRRALVAEDDWQVRSLVTKYLELERFRVDQAIDVPSGIGALASEYDIVITDLKMPGASGIELVAAAKSRWPETEVIVITGLQDAAVAAEALAAGADRYLFKPFGMPDLRRHLLDALGGRDQAVARKSNRTSGRGAALTRAQLVDDAVAEGTASLMRAAEARDPHMAGHGVRVATLAQRIADELDPGRTIVDRAALERGCRLLDIGKVGLPDETLNKESALSAQERREIEAHPLIGRTLLGHLVNEDEVLAVLTWHHEHWDGNGYPNGLSGGAIPLIARIAAVCDGLDAITSDRPYRAAKSFEVALAELRAYSGGRYDPAVIEAMDACAGDLERIHRSRASK